MAFEPIDHSPIPKRMKSVATKSRIIITSLAHAMAKDKNQGVHS